ncbi:MAG: SIS domain-containing protein [Candidatus Caldatribacteriaceae bacterium]
MNQLYREIAEQPGVFQRIAQTYAREEVFQEWRESHQGKIYLTGMGSSLFAAYPACLYLLERGFPVVWIDASELLHYGLLGIKSEDTLVCVSQSGESYEILEILSRLSSRPRLVAFTSSPKSTLARKAEVSIDILSGTEYAVTSTKTHTATLVTLNLWAMAQAQDREGFLHASLDLELLAEEAERLVTTSAEWAKRVLKNLEFAQSAETKVIIARGPNMSAAWHGCLCFYECAKETFLGFSGGQFRHGPLELAVKTMLAVFLALPGKTESLMVKRPKSSQRGGLVFSLSDEVLNLSITLRFFPSISPTNFLPRLYRLFHSCFWLTLWLRKKGLSQERLFD